MNKNKWYVTKIFNIATGHRLSKNKGLCKNIHGHGLKIEVTVSSLELDKDDMVIDFSYLKDLVNDTIEKLDHCLLLNEKDTEFVEFAKKQNLKYIKISNSDPTAERLCQLLYEEIGINLSKYNLNIIVEKIGIWESPNSYCEFKKEKF